jgi:hypothetical protein
METGTTLLRKGKSPYHIIPGFFYGFNQLVSMSGTCYNYLPLFQLYLDAFHAADAFDGFLHGVFTVIAAHVFNL